MFFLALLACTSGSDVSIVGTKPPQETSTKPKEPAVLPVIDYGAALFDRDAPMDIAIELSDDALGALREEPREWVTGTVTVADFPEVEVGLRLKGNGSFQEVDNKPSWKVDINRVHAGSRIDGLASLVLNNMITDPSGLRERAAYATYQHMGVPAPRTQYATVTLNGMAYGTYVVVEDVDALFLSRWFEEPKGPLYEMFDVDITTEGVDALDHDGGPDNRAILHTLAAELADPNHLVSQSRTLNVDAFIDYFATSAVIAQTDAYPYSFPGDDVYLYVNPSDDKVYLLPHGGDETFEDRARPVDFPYGLLGVACMADPICEEKFDARIWSVMDEIDDWDLRLVVDRWGGQVSAAALAVNTTQSTSTVQTSRSELHQFIFQRREDLENMPGIEQ